MRIIYSYLCMINDILVSIYLNIRLSKLQAARVKVETSRTYIGYDAFER